MTLASDIEAPYAALTPDVVLDAVEAAGLLPDGRMLALGSYENRVYQIGIDDGSSVVAKFYRPARWTDAQILEEHAFTAELAAAEIPVTAPLDLADGASLMHHDGFAYALFARHRGRPANLDDSRVLRSIGLNLGRLHAVGAGGEFAHRVQLGVELFGDAAREFVLAHGFIPEDLRPASESVSAQALDGIRHAFDRAGPLEPIRLHGDCHGGNILWSEPPAAEGPQFVDFDDCCTGPAVQDLWMLLAGDRAEQSQGLAALLGGYRMFMDFDPRELNVVEALRTLRLLHYAAWIARRWGDPAFPAAFPWFNTQRYWQDRILELREQIALMDEPPLEIASR
jgi:Ser/Thr protein kinase RdoA (MazF antagonist)